jgi:hypothetical protein
VTRPERVQAPASRALALEVAVLRTVAYASLFDYPLTPEQVGASLVGAAADEAAVLACYRSSPWLQAVVEYAEGFLFLRGRRDVVAERRAREIRTRALVTRHRRVLRIICALPFVRLVALSGSAAHGNVGPDGDLDLFVVTAGARVWSVTLAIVAITRLLGCRKAVCANYVVSERALACDPADLFTANQILHLRVLAGEPLFGAVMAANPFVAAYYPGWRRVPRTVPGFEPSRAVRVARRVVEWALSWGPAQFAERLARRVYIRHLEARAAGWRSPECVRLEPEQLKLHTASHRRAIMARFEAEVARLCAEADRASHATAPTRTPALPPALAAGA